MKTMITKLGISVVAVLAVGHLEAQTVDMTLESTIADTGFSATMSGDGTMINTDDLIGIYAFQVNSVTPASTLIGSAGSTLYAICLSPQGNLGFGYEGSYALQTFAQAGNGQYPTAWVTPQGIQNANYLFSTYASQLEAGNLLGGSFGGSVNDQAAALALAMYTALYNSTAYGVAANGTVSSGFDVTLSGGSVATDYSAFLSALTGYNGSPLAVGYVLTPDAGQPNAEQTMIFTPVPEASTIIAGALMVLPFGASTLRILRKKCAA
jgi:hypothetical protein